MYRIDTGSQTTAYALDNRRVLLRGASPLKHEILTALGLVLCHNPLIVKRLRPVPRKNRYKILALHDLLRKAHDLTAAFQAAPELRPLVPFLSRGVLDLCVDNWLWDGRTIVPIDIITETG